MDSVIVHILTWPSLVMALLMFGFAPGAVLRIIVLAFRRNDPRRSELLGELPNVPRIERPFWVCEQLEIALFEGLLKRLAEAIKRGPAAARRILPPFARIWRHDGRARRVLFICFSVVALVIIAFILGVLASPVTLSIFAPEAWLTRTYVPADPWRIITEGWIAVFALLTWLGSGLWALGSFKNNYTQSIWGKKFFLTFATLGAPPVAAIALVYFLTKKKWRL